MTAGWVRERVRGGAAGSSSTYSRTFARGQGGEGGEARGGGGGAGASSAQGEAAAAARGQAG